MTTITVQACIDAPPAAVFDAVTNLQQLPETHPDILRVAILSDQQSGVGTRFRETRSMNGREMHTELEVTEHEESHRARMVADSHGTIWDTIFLVTPAGNGTTLELRMDCRAHRLLPRLLNPLMKGLFRKGLVRHLEAVKAWCESRTG